MLPALLMTLNFLSLPGATASCFFLARALANCVADEICLSIHLQFIYI